MIDNSNQHNMNRKINIREEPKDDIEMEDDTHKEFMSDYDNNINI